MDFIDYCRIGKIEEIALFLDLMDENDPDINDGFRIACKYGELETIQYIYSKSKKRIQVSDINYWAFRIACRNGHLHIAQQLYAWYPDINLHILDEDPMRAACEKGSIDLAMQLWDWGLDCGKPINLHVQDESIFRTCCIRNHLSLAKMIWGWSGESINLRSKNDDFFRICAEFGYLEFMKQLLNWSPEIDIHTQDDMAFKLACKYGQYEIVRFLVNLDEKMDVHMHDEEPFRNACHSGSLFLVRYLWHLSDRTIDISANQDQAFRWASLRGHNHIVEQLLIWNPEINICSNRYEVLHYSPKEKRVELFEILSAYDHEIRRHFLDYDNFRKICESGDLPGLIEFRKTHDLLTFISTMTLETLPKEIEKYLDDFLFIQSFQPILEGRTECPICKFSDVEIATTCGHSFCVDCLRTWLKKADNCPYCRTTILVNG